MTDEDVEFVEMTPADDVIKARSPRPPARWTVRPWWLAALLVAVLVAGIGIGYAVGRHTSKVARPTASVPIVAEVSVVNSTGNVCYGQPASSTRLMLGVEIVNDASRPITIGDVHGVFPRGGLREVSATSGECDETSVRPVAGSVLRPRTTEWVTVTVEVLKRCPRPLPAQFQVDYAIGGASESVTLRAFADLGGVSYSGCR
jgi:hypothetical protein